MTTIFLKKTPEGYKASSKTSEALMQHLLNSDYIEIFNVSEEKMRTVAAAHGWKIVVEDSK